MNINNKLRMASFFCLLLSGCASTGQTYNRQSLSAPQKGKEQLIIYRTSSIVGLMESPRMIVDGVPTCSMSVDSYMVTAAAPGKTSVVSSEYGGLVKSTLSFEGKAGHRYFVRLAPNEGKAIAGGFGAVGAAAYDISTDDHGVYNLRLVDKSDAAEEIGGTKQTTSCD